jgi:hypothetical protein
MNALQDFPLVEVQKACIAAISAKPDKMPNEGHVKAQILLARHILIANQSKTGDPLPPKQKMSADMKARADAIIAGFNKGKVL